MDWIGSFPRGQKKQAGGGDLYIRNQDWDGEVVFPMEGAISS